MYNDQRRHWLFLLSLKEPPVLVLTFTKALVGSPSAS